MPELEPMKWTPERPQDNATGPLHYTAPGGWLIVNDPDPHAPDRPWVLYRHGTQYARCHTLRIAKREALLHTVSNEAGAHPETALAEAWIDAATPPRGGLSGGYCR